MAAYLVDFTTAYSPAPAFYSGTGATTLVPNVFPVAINGRPYLVDTKAGSFQRQYDARVRDSVDQSAEPGESAINHLGIMVPVKNMLTPLTLKHTVSTLLKVCMFGIKANVLC
ncbi:MAG: hypothetical protein EBT44_05870 [Actinobacteria bacterium]|uniref:Uncharacterized protein n=1 Tax=Candidatus Fonsibacter lacus TaxID=2576439 RepID=A0A965LLR9_9PROT|nr:hypothetical protein [Candidatus Fonsibacter lacus]